MTTKYSKVGKKERKEAFTSEGRPETVSYLEMFLVNKVRHCAQKTFGIPLEILRAWDMRERLKKGFSKKKKIMLPTGVKLYKTVQKKAIATVVRSVTE